MKPIPQWSIRWNPDQGWEVIGPKPKWSSGAFHVVVPLYVGEHWAKQRYLKLREEVVQEIERGREILIDHKCYETEDERIAAMEEWLGKFTERFKPTSGEYAEIAHGVYSGPWGYVE